MSEFEERIEKASYLHFLLIGLLLGAVYYFNYFDGGASYESQIQGQQNQLQSLRTELNEIETLTANYEKYQQDLNKLSEKFEVALDYLPSRENVYVIIKQLYNVAKVSGVNVTLVKPGEQNLKRDFYEEMPISIEIKGGYVQLLTFLSQVVNLPRIINLVDVVLVTEQNQNSSPLLKLTGEMKAYRYLENPEPQETKGESQ